MLLNKEQILNSEDSKFEIVDVPEWGGQVKVVTMSGFARDRFEMQIMGSKGKMDMVNIRAKLGAATIVDEQGNLLFTEDDITKLGNKSGAALDRVFSVAQRLNHLTQSDVDALTKNS